ncbi:hypothetical protein C8F04DRAFT_1112757 [Mycena alexandri]|uniref:Uncharacterized protein n=1 Tax=Mycena alexandri TaxID=1745969 RepID=A0AAD6SQF2_9AGAR|nr:hypothetical protein C8F04DRAFT_1112757 [Mycena alexandri]
MAAGPRSAKETNEKLHSDLTSLFKNAHFDFSKPSDHNVTILLSSIAECTGRNFDDLRSIWRKRSGDNAQFIAAWKKETLEGSGDYEKLIDQFSSSVNIILPAEADKIISSYLEGIKPALEDFLTTAEPLPLWLPDDTLPYADFLKGMKMPASAKNEPDMLLYRLGHAKENENLEKLVRKIFPSKVVGRRVQILLNTSGAGKTRTVLEGLCDLWGLYLTCYVDSEGCGSADVQRATSRIETDPCFVLDLPEDYAGIHKANCAIAQRRFGEVLLARLCILEFFCQTAREISGGVLTDEHRKLWVLLQIRPSCLGGEFDIFTTLTERITGIGDTDRVRLVELKMLSLPILLGTKNPLYCVVDEVQVAARALPKAFATFDPRKTTRRSSLRELARALVASGWISLTLTGTALDKQMIQEIMASPVFKDTLAVTTTHFGAFNKAEEQIAYLKRFLPPQLAEGDSFQELFHRVPYWLKGRYRFTAAYVKDLLLNGFQRPHRMLNEFVRLSTVVEIPGTIQRKLSPGFRPTDSVHAAQEVGDAVPRELMHFQFDKLKKVPTLEQIIRTHTHQCVMRSVGDRLTADSSHFDLIECGFARYAENDVGNDKAPQITLDEPLAVLALTEWLQHCDLPLAEILRLKAAEGITAADGANGLEEYLAMYFSAVFDDETPLTEIFKFHKYLDPPKWARLPATLVSVFWEDSGPEAESENLRGGFVRDQQRPSAPIGYKARKRSDTLGWLELRDRNRAPICFPDTNMGPDIMFVLRLQDEKKSLIWVALQSKFDSSDNILASNILRKAVPTVTPSEFYGFRKDLKEPNAQDSNPEKTKRNNAEALERIDLLPDRLLPKPVPESESEPEPESESESGSESEPEPEPDKEPQAMAEKARAMAQPEKAQAMTAADLEKKQREEKKKMRNARRRIIMFHDAKRKQGATGKSEGTLKLTPHDLNILQEAGEHSVLRVVVAWPARTHMHDRALTVLESKGKDCYFDEYNHPIVELNIEHWGKTMQKLHPSPANYVLENWRGADLAVTGQKRRAVGEADGAPPKKNRKTDAESAFPVEERIYGHPYHFILPRPRSTERGRSPSAAPSGFASATAPPSSGISEDLSDDDTMTDFESPANHVASGSPIASASGSHQPFLLPFDVVGTASSPIPVVSRARKPLPRRTNGSISIIPDPAVPAKTRARGKRK